jgi:hypothetical protein
MDEKEQKAIFIDTLFVNVDNNKLSDAEFRTFVRNSLVQFNHSAPTAQVQIKTIGK